MIRQSYYTCFGFRSLKMLPELGNEPGIFWFISISFLLLYHSATPGKQKKFLRAKKYNNEVFYSNFDLSVLFKNKFLLIKI
jgi:hypothetical protein